jgi:hypothetical protein
MKCPIETEYTKATYIPSKNDDYRGNPFIETLPLRKNFNDYWDEVEEQVEVPEDFADLDTETLEQKASKIMSSVCPTSVYYDVYCDILHTLKVGYSERNPLEEDVHCWQNQIASGKYYRKRTTAPSLKFTGYSGVGKTTLIDANLQLIDPVFIHPAQGPMGYEEIQIVYIKINIPGDADVHSICLLIAGEIDSILKTDYMDQYEKLSAAKTIPKLITVCTSLLIGMIIFDEMQNICLAKPGARKNLFTFFARLTNDALVPTLKIGTSKADRLTEFEFSNAKRLGVPYELKNYQKTDQDWKTLVNYAWDYQLLPKYTELSDKFKNQIYILSQGIPHCLFFLIEQANILGLRKGFTQFDSKLLLAVYDTKFNLMKPALIALKHKRYEAFDDLMNASTSVGRELEKMVKALFKISDKHKLKGKDAKEVLERIQCFLPEFKMNKTEEKIFKRLEKETDLVASELIDEGGYKEVPI